jgi:hypothetical protein
MHQERPFQQQGCSSMMKTSDQYREFAEECGRLAKETNIERHRKMLEEMAAEWRRLAAEVDKET